MEKFVRRYGIQLGKYFSLSFDGTDPSQPVTTPGTGSGWAIMNASRTQLNYTFAFAQLSGRVTAAHFHYNKSRLAKPYPTQNITVTDTSGNGCILSSWTALTPAQADSLPQSSVYINLHTAANPNGEIRAQVNPIAGTGYVLGLNGAKFCSSGYYRRSWRRICCFVGRFNATLPNGHSQV